MWCERIAAPARGRPQLGAGRGGGSGRRIPTRRSIARGEHGIGEWLAHRLSQATGAEARATVLGHVQRGAMPTAEDRLLASALGVRAVDLLADGKADRMVAWWNRQVIDVPLEKVVGRSRTVDRDGALIRTARALGICLGDAGYCLPCVFRTASVHASLMRAMVHALNHERAGRSTVRKTMTGHVLARAIQNTSPSLCSVSSHRKGSRGNARSSGVRPRPISHRSAPFFVRCRGASARMRRTRSRPSSPAASARRGS